MTFEEKQQMKLERYQELANKNKQQSESVYNAGKRISDGIPFGQPLLPFHHSYKRALKDQERIHNSMRKSIELSEKSEYYKNKVKNILNPRAISSDNPEAITLLNKKLAHLEAKREKIKAFNKESRKNKTEQVPSYSLTNLSQNIASVKKRIEYLNKMAKVSDTEEKIGDITIKVDKDDNRVKIFFSGKPNEEIRTELKHNGFRWSPYNKAWQRQISEWAIDIAKKIAGGNNDKFL